MRLRSHRPTRSIPPGLTADWVERVGDRSETAGPSLRDAARDLVATLQRRSCEIDAALHHFGRQAGNAGWGLTETASWLDELLGDPDHHRLPLQRFEAGLSLADGWMEGVQHALGAEAVTDPLTGLGTPAVLDLRLHEVDAHCRSLGITPSAAYEVGVIDVDLASTSPLVRDAARIVLADHVMRRFTSGETLCSCGDRILVLASATPVFAKALEALADELREVTLLQRSAVLVWVEPLPPSTDQLDRFLVDLIC